MNAAQIFLFFIKAICFWALGVKYLAFVAEGFSNATMLVKEKLRFYFF